MLLSYCLAFLSSEAPHLEVPEMLSPDMGEQPSIAREKRGMVQKAMGYEAQRPVDGGLNALKTLL